MSLWSWKQVGEYRSVLEEQGLIDDARALTEDLVDNLRRYWEGVARVLGKLEGISTYYVQSPEAERVKEVAGEEIEYFIHELVALRREYSEVSHEFMYEVMYSEGKGLYFMGQVLKINTRDLERVAYPKKQLERTRELMVGIKEAIDALMKSAQYVTNIVGRVREINELLSRAGLEPAWNVYSVELLSFELGRKEWELLAILDDLAEIIRQVLEEPAPEEEEE